MRPRIEERGTATHQDQGTTRSTENTDPPAPKGPPFDLSQEVRLAVVMYGGVSLACYISGVTEELYNLVRATADVRKDRIHDDPVGLAENDLCGTQKIYRKLSQALVRGEKPKDPKAVDRASPIRTRFRIDILSGSSAGGINAIFLAKGLANDQKIGQLRQLWIEHADIDVLLNDRRPRGSRPSSLLNGRYLYDNLLAALDEMDRVSGDRTESFVSTNVNELDLYITATDIRGIPLPLRLADKVVSELRHKKVFHFVYSTADANQPRRNDFVQEYNRFLAFAARCTSAFPFAFEPETLADIETSVTRGTRPDDVWDERWEIFLEEYLHRDNAPADKPDPRAREDILKRPFGDGGYLDNKPFSYAIDSLLRRRADVPVERKLLYIEPVPEHPENQPTAMEDVDAFQNVRAALLTLPRQETIRGDLQRVLQRNQLIERVANFTSGIEEDLRKLFKRKLPPPPAWNTWGAQDLTDMIRKKGVSFGGYHRLKVAALMDEIAAAIALGANLDPDSDYKLAIRHMVNAWRDRNYVRYHNDSQDPPRQTENKLLVEFDLSYRMRRLTFVRGKLESLANIDAETSALIGSLLAWHEDSIVDGLGQPDLVRFAGAIGGLRAAIRLVRQQADDLDELTAGKLDEDVAKFRERAQRLPEPHGDLEERSRALPLEALTKSYRAAQERWGEIDQRTALRKNLKDALAALDEPLLSLEWEVDSRRQASSEFQTLSPVWAEVADQLQNATGLNVLQSETFQEGFRAELQEVKGELDDVLDSLRDLYRDFWDPRRLPDPKAGEDHRERFRGLIRETGVSRCELKKLLESTTEGERRAYAGTLLDRNDAAFEKVARFLGRRVRAVTFLAARRCTSYLDSYAPPRSVRESPISQIGCLVARTCARHYYDYYDEYDHVLFPILYQTDVGEVAKVDIFRISPEDSHRLTDLPKLAGTALANFGAFFDATWRANDILWGRLDGAQRLLDVLLPGTENQTLHDELLVEAHEAILREVLKPSDRAELRRRLVRSLVQVSAGRTLDETLSDVVEDLRRTTPRNAKLDALLRVCLEDRELVDYFWKTYQVDRSFDPRQTLRLLARSTQIVGGMLENLAQRYHVDNQTVAWVTRVGQIFWGIVEVAVPDSTWNLVTRNLLNLLMLLEVLLLAGGTILVNRDVQQFALITLGATLGFRLGLVLLGQYMLGRYRVWEIIKYGIIIMIVGLGVYQLLEIAVSLSNDLQGWVLGVSPRYRLVLAAVAAAAIIVPVLAVSGGRTILTRIRRRRRTAPAKRDA